MIDCAVIKEPFQDRFAIFGIDIDAGQRYELRLSSDEVSSLLDGDILVTSLENIEVWVVLLNKLSLPPVEVFTKIPHELLRSRAFEPKPIPSSTTLSSRAVATTDERSRKFATLSNQGDEHLRNIFPTTF